MNRYEAAAVVWLVAIVAAFVALSVRYPERDVPVHYQRSR